MGYSLMRSQRVGLDLVSKRTHTVVSKTHSQAKLDYLEVKNGFNIFVGLKKMYIFGLQNLLMGNRRPHLMSLSKNNLVV